MKRGWKYQAGIGLCVGEGEGAGGAGGAGAGGQAGGGQGGDPGAGGAGSGGNAGAGGDGGAGNAAAWHENAGWFDALPEGLKGASAALEGFKGKALGEVLSGLTQRVAESSPPATPKDYQIRLPARPDGTPADPKAIPEGFLEAMHAAGATGKVLQAMVDFEAGRGKAAYDATVKAEKEAADALKSKWGAKYDERVTLTSRAIETFPEGIRKIITDEKLGSDPFFIELIYTIGEAQREGRLHQGDPGSQRKSTADLFYGPNPK